MLECEPIFKTTLLSRYVTNLESSKHIKDSMVVTAFHQKSMPIEHARNQFKLSEALEHKRGVEEDIEEAQTLKINAEAALRAKHPELTSKVPEDDYDQFIPIFWR